MLVDDHPIVRDGLQRVLEFSGDYEVVGLAADGADAVKIASELEPDLIIMDVMLPKKDGVNVCREIMDILPDTRVLMLTASTDEDTAMDAVAAGATGYLQKFAGMERLLSTVRDVASGEFRVPANVARRVVAGLGGERPILQPAGSELTTREREILTQFAGGLSVAQIAQARFNSPVTIRNAIYGIRKKLGVKTRQEIVVWAVRNGLLDDDDDQSKL